MVCRWAVRIALPTFMAVALLAACGPATDSVESGSATEKIADLVLKNGKIITVDSDLPQAEALAAYGGKITALGTTAEIEQWIGDATEVIDLDGRLAIPGFIEGHGHFMGLGDSRIQLDLRRAETWQDIVAMVAEAAAEAASGEWIRGRGWHQDKWTSAPTPNVEGFPLHDDLSAISPDNPVLLTHASGHALFANAKAMELAQITGSTADPPGGEILKDLQGRPMGIFRETAQELIQNARGEGAVSSPQEGRRMVELASAECLAKGVTSFQDAGSSFETVDFLRQMAEEGILGPRLWMMIRASNEELQSKIGEYWTMTANDPNVKVGGIKLSIDGALGARGAWLLEPYSDSPSSTGLNLVPIETARETAQIAIENQVQLCIHAIGDRANREVLDIFQNTFEQHPEKQDLRWRVEHAQHLHPEEIPRFAALGVIASIQAVHCTSDGPWVPDRLGDQRSEEGAYVWRKLLDSGARVINGTDVPVEDIDPIANFFSSVTRRMADGTAFYPDQKMGRLEALATYTREAAYAVFEENEKGTLTVGKLADITVLSKDILTVPENEILDTEVVFTIQGGEVLYRGGNL